MASPITRILRSLSEKLINFYENPPKKLLNEKQAEDRGKDVQKTYSEWLRKVAKLGDNFLELPSNSIIVSPSTPNGDFQIIDNGTLGDVLTSNGTSLKPSFQAPSGGGGGGTWGGIVGTLSDQTDLQTELNNKANNLIASFTPVAGTIIDGDTVQESIEKLSGNISDLSTAITEIGTGNKLFNYYNFR